MTTEITVNKTKFDQLLENFTTLQQTINVISTDVKSLGSRFTVLEGRTAALEKRLDEVDNTSIALETAVHNVHTSVSTLGVNVTEVKQSADFISEKYETIAKQTEDNKKSIQNLINNVTAVTQENITLKTMIAGYKHELELEKAARNAESQYHRTSINVKVCGVPMQQGEEVQGRNPTNPVTREVLNRVCEAANITLGFDDVDVCHRLGSEQRSPIIVRFSGKSARYSFFNQRDALKRIKTTNLRLGDLPPSEARPEAQGREPRRGGYARGGRDRQAVTFGPDTEPHDIFLQEHLTTFTKSLLNETKNTLKELEPQWAYPGYIKDGTVRVKRYANDHPTIIRCKDDIEKAINNRRDDASGH